MQGKGGREDLCCVLSASIPLSDPGEREQREKGEMFLVQFLCLICNRPISIPAGQLTNGSLLLKLRRTGGKKNPTVSVSHRQRPPSLNVSDCHTWTASKDFNFSRALCWYYLFAVIWYLFPPYKSLSVACLRATWGYRMLYININKRKRSKGRQREAISASCSFSSTQTMQPVVVNAVAKYMHHNDACRYRV